MNSKNNINIFQEYPDSNLLSKLTQCVVRNFGEENRDDFLAQLESFKNTKNKHYGLYIEDENAQIIALILGVQNFGCEHFLDLGWICTDETYRGQGISSKMIEEIGNIWKEAGITKFPHLFISNYKETIPFYEKRGFEALFSHHSKAVIMVKKLFH